ncbi:hypothetical protein Q4610_18810 [Sphingobium sp. HBC34]|uniref:Uncharacterized protein n=1 Tax=Sphingobium cyanobacteriorum TaxID=3063954 RepID=A0ABT8ZSZ1_9SPHN|nr:hypothetical protein [Sphingobium sp. HBC34]MDO7837099.1 hypothetical protein [Sphingobium sp. HBC34]
MALSDFVQKPIQVTDGEHKSEGETEIVAQALDPVAKPWLSLGLLPTFGTFLLLAGCSLHGPLGLDDKSAVRTSAYSANKVLFLNPTTMSKPAQPGVKDELRYAELLEAHQVAADIQAGRTSKRRSVLNRQPVSIVINRAYVPATLRQCAKRLSDIFGKRRDIAVLLETSTANDKQESIAVWYQQGVMIDGKSAASTDSAGVIGGPQPDGTLNFQDLLVFSEDSWNSNFPPYFRMRLIDVSAERNTGVGALLDQIEGSTKAITGLIGVPDSPLIGIAKLAAKQILGNEENIPILDFTFQLYGSSMLDEAGGVPLGVLQTGGVVVTAPPCGSDNSYWDEKLKFDYTLNRIEDITGEVREQPYIFATILTSDLAVPSIVRTRSDAIMKRLTDPKVTGDELLVAQADAAKLTSALSVLATREAFRRRPNKASFAKLVGDASAKQIDESEKGFYLDTFYRATQRNLPDFAAYGSWVLNCSAAAEFDAEAGYFKKDKSVNGVDGQPCWLD